MTENNVSELSQCRDDRENVQNELKTLADVVEREQRNMTPEEFARSEELSNRDDNLAERIKTLESCEKIKAKTETKKYTPHAGQHVFVRSEPTKADYNQALLAWATRGRKELKRYDSWMRSADRCNIDINDDVWICRDQTSDVNSEGGYSVNGSQHIGFSDAQLSFGGLASVCEHIHTTDYNLRHISVWDDTATEAAKTAQADTVNSVDETVGKVDLYAFIASTGLYPVAIQYFDSVNFDLNALLNTHLLRRLARRVADKVVNGTGSTSEASGLLHTVNCPVNGFSNNLALENLEDLYGSVDPFYRENAVWVMNDTTWNQIYFGLVDETGRPLGWALTNNLASAPDKTLFGKRVVIDQSYPDMASGQARIPITFGDHSYHKLRTVGGPTIARDNSIDIKKLSISFVAYQGYGAVYAGHFAGDNDAVQGLKTGTLSGD